MTTDKRLYEAYRFFKEHAGYCVGHRAEGALALARAERRLQESDLEVTWEDEQESYFDAMGILECCEQANRKCEHVHGGSCLRRYVVCQDHAAHNEMYWAHIDDDGEVLAGLGMIDTCSNPYRRVVEAELALEAFGILDDRDAEERQAIALEHQQASEVFNYCAL